MMSLRFLIKNHIKVLILVLSFFYSTISWSQEYSPNTNHETNRIWKKISPFFSPPEKLKDKYGEYSSLMEFHDGSMVKTPEDWKERRKEILSQWHNMMGEWPQLLKDQELEVIATRRREGLTEHKVQFYWTPAEKTEGYLLVPDGEGKKPAVITVYYEPETAVGLTVKPHRDFAYQLSKRGFVTLSIGTSETTKAKTYSIHYPDIKNVQVEPLSMLAYAAANAWHVLSKVPKVDSTRIGIMGHSYGGKWAMFASCMYDKFACGVWSDPGIVFDEDRPSVNYWEPWYLGNHPPPWRKRGLITKENPARGLYPQLVKKGHDLHELHALMAPRPFLVSGGSEDPQERWIPLNHTIEVNNLLGYKNRVAMTNRPEHSPNAESNEQIFLFLEYFLMY